MVTGQRIAATVASLSVTLALLASAPAPAQVQRSGGGANQQLYADYQQAITERAQLQSDNAKLKQDLADAQKQVATLKQQLAAAKTGGAGNQAALQAAQAAQANTAKSLQALRAQTGELIGRFRDTVSTLRDVESDRTQLRQQLAQSKAAYDQCAVTNYNLYQVDDEVLNRYSHQGIFSRIARDEPFTRLERTRIDNYVVEYRERAEELRVPSSSGTVPAAPSTGAAPTPAPGTTPNPGRK